MEVTVQQNPDERMDTSDNDPARQQSSCGECGMIPWCEVEMLQDVVCGNGLSLMTESRDDDNIDNTSTQLSIKTDGGDDGCINERIVKLSKELQSTTKGSVSGEAAVTTDRSTLATVSILDNVVKSSSLQTSRYENFMVSVNTAAKTYGSQSTHVAELYVMMGTELTSTLTTDDVDTDANKSKEFAALLLEEAFTIYQAKLGDNNDQTIDARVNLGLAYRSLARYDDALDCFCLAVYMREAIRGELHPSVADIWVLVSSIHHANKKLEMALKASAKALTAYRAARGDKHQTVINVLKTIAQIHIEMGNNDKASDINKYVKLHDKS